MAKHITTEEIKHLGTLARVAIPEESIEKLATDLNGILDHVAQLQSVDTTGVTGATGGTNLMNVFREDGSRRNTLQGKGVENFPEVEAGMLKVPPVFS